MNPLGLAFFILYWVVFVYSIVLHELAHGWSSLRLGDPTALKAGRLTLDPFKHIDLMHSVLMPIMFFVTMGVPFGGAKPVPVNPYLYKNLRWGSLISAAAGPATNLLLALFFALALNASRMAAGLGPGELDKLPLTGQFLGACMLTNLFLAVFNMLPVPPLDGSHIFASLLPRGAQGAYGRLQAGGFMPVIILVIVDRLAAPRIGFSLLSYLILYPTYWLLRVMQIVGDMHELKALWGAFNILELVGGGGG